MRSEIHLSRCVRIEDVDSIQQFNCLTLLYLEKNEKGLIVSYRIEKYEREIHSVLYHDNPLLLRRDSTAIFFVLSEIRI